MTPALIALATQIGVPLIRDILTGKIGAQNTALAEDVLGAVARRVGIDPGPGASAALEGLAGGTAQAAAPLREAMLAVEREVAPEMVALYASELEAKRATFAAEEAEPLWARLWRPLGMYWLFALWTWNLIVLHVANAIWKIALPPVDLGVLLQLTTLYLSLYMGGHTVKAVVQSWSSRP